MAVVKTLIGNIKGVKGDAGAKGDTGEKGDIGATGQRGSRWTQGTSITGTSTTDTVFSGSGISDALVNDNYLNTSTGNTYRCTVGGDASTAMWVYSGNIKGVKGDAGAKGDKGDTGATGPKGEKGEKGDNGVNSFSDHDTATSGTSFTDAEDGNMLVTDWTKNLLNPTLQTTVQNGVTCTNNGDGTYTIDTGGSPATGNTIFTLSTFIFNANTKYKLIGCPSGGSNSTYRLDTAGINSDIGNGSDVQFTQDATYDIRIDIASGTVCDNLIFKPMLTTDLNATYDDFVPYVGYEIHSCGKNLLNPNDYIDGRNIKNDFDTLYSVNTNTDGRAWIYGNSNYYFKAKTQNMTLIIDVVESFNSGGFGVISEDGIYIYEHFGGGLPNTGIHKYVLNVEPEKMYGIMLKIYSGKVKISLYNSDETDFEPYTGETITVTNDTESPAFGLKSHKGITNIISPGNVKCVYPTNESGKGVLDAMYNNSQLSNELSKLKNAIIAMGGTV